MLEYRYHPKVKMGIWVNSWTFAKQWIKFWIHHVAQYLLRLASWIPTNLGGKDTSNDSLFWVMIYHSLNNFKRLSHIISREREWRRKRSWLHKEHLVSLGQTLCKLNLTITRVSLSGHSVIRCITHQPSADQAFKWITHSLHHKQVWYIVSCMLPVWPDKNRQMSLKVAQKWFH